MITVVQRAKFALMYRTDRIAVIQQDFSGDDEAAIVPAHSENSITQPAIVEVAGLRLHSATPKSAADAAKINEAITSLHQALPPIIP